MRHIHGLTPGDHFSPRTGSAIPTVVHSLSRHADERSTVLVARGTHDDRYGSADVIEYPMARSMYAPSRTTRIVDAAAGRLGRPRPWMTSVLRQMLVEQESWAPAAVIAHNAPQLVPLVSDRHLAVLHAHNAVLRSYATRESGRALSGVHRIVCVSDWLADVTSARLPRHLRDRIRVVHNGVDAAAFGAVPRTSRPGGLRVAFVGRVLPWKGPDVLLNALLRLHRADIHVRIVGSAGFDREAPLTAFETQLRRLGGRIPGGAEFVPSQDREGVARLLADVDVCVVPSVEPEPFGLVALEAMAAGAAVVAARSGGLPEAVGSAGLVVDPGDVEQLAGVLESLAEDEGRVAELGAAGRRRAREMDWSAVAGRYARALA